MASLVLSIAGSAIGSSLLGSGLTIFGATITGAEIGGAIGTIIGTELDNLIAPGTHVTRKSPRLSDVNIQSSMEGAPIPRLYGREADGVMALLTAEAYAEHPALHRNEIQRAA